MTSGEKRREPGSFRGKFIDFIRETEPKDILLVGQFDEALAAYRRMAESGTLGATGLGDLARTLAKMQKDPSAFYEAVAKVNQELRERGWKPRYPRQLTGPFME